MTVVWKTKMSSLKKKETVLRIQNADYRIVRLLLCLDYITLESETVNEIVMANLTKGIKKTFISS